MSRFFVPRRRFFAIARTDFNVAGYGIGNRLADLERRGILVGVAYNESLTDARFYDAYADITRIDRVVCRIGALLIVAVVFRADVRALRVNVENNVVAFDFPTGSPEKNFELSYSFPIR